MIRIQRPRASRFSRVRNRLNMTSTDDLARIYPVPDHASLAAICRIIDQIRGEKKAAVV